MLALDPDALNKHINIQRRNTYLQTITTVSSGSCVTPIATQVNVGSSSCQVFTSDLLTLTGTHLYTVFHLEEAINVPLLGRDDARASNWFHQDRTTARKPFQVSDSLALWSPSEDDSSMSVSNAVQPTNLSRLDSKSLPNSNSAQSQNIAQLNLLIEDVPAPATLFRILQLNAPCTLSFQEIVDTIQGLAHIGADAVLDGFPQYLQPMEASLSMDQLIMLLTVATRYLAVSSLTLCFTEWAARSARGASVLSPKLNVKLWDSLGLYVTWPLCQDMIALPGMVGIEERWLWKSLASLVCNKDCEVDSNVEYTKCTGLLPTIKESRLHAFLDRCSWRVCSCRRALVDSERKKMQAVAEYRMPRIQVVTQASVPPVSQAASEISKLREQHQGLGRKLLQRRRTMQPPVTVEGALNELVLRGVNTGSIEPNSDDNSSFNSVCPATPRRPAGTGPAGIQRDHEPPANAILREPPPT